MESGFKSFAEVIEFALEREEEACEFYDGLAEKTEDPLMRMIFRDFVGEEKRHKHRLENIGGETGVMRLIKGVADPVRNLQIAETLEDVKVSPGMSFRDALVVAMKREEKSYRLYSLLAELSDDDHLSLLFAGLAREELGHKLRIEEVYQDLYGKREAGSPSL